MRDDILAEKTHAIIGSAIEVHRALGPGLLESTYRACLVRQLTMDGMTAEAEAPISIEYKGHLLDAGYRADIVVDKAVLIELKAVETLVPIHEAQLLTYLRHTRLPVGLLINFNVRTLTNGVRRFARTREIALN